MQLKLRITLLTFCLSLIHMFPCRSRSLRTPANMFIINLAITDFLMCVTQTPTFFITSMNKRWIFGEKGNHHSAMDTGLLNLFIFFNHSVSVHENGKKVCNIKSGLEAGFEHQVLYVPFIHPFYTQGICYSYYSFLFVIQ